MTVKSTAANSKPLILADTKLAPEGWNEPNGRGVVFWQTLICREKTPSEGLSGGIAILPAGGFLALHRHQPPEIYHVIEGSAEVTVDGTTHNVGVGDTVFIPPMAEHGIRNQSDANFRILYVFPTDSFGEIEYIFS
jgi:quercetin dioxygenase-like cupin family protein